MTEKEKEETRRTNKDIRGFLMMGEDRMKVSGGPSLVQKLIRAAENTSRTITTSNTIKVSATTTKSNLCPPSLNVKSPTDTTSPVVGVGSRDEVVERRDVLNTVKDVPKLSMLSCLRDLPGCVRDLWPVVDAVVPGPCRGGQQAVVPVVCGQGRGDERGLLVV